MENKHLTDDPNHPDLKRYTGPEEPGPQNKVYLVLSDEERAKGWVRPYRDAYVHDGLKPKYSLSPLTEEQQKNYGDTYVAFEPYPGGGRSAGRYWTQKELDTKGCGSVTTMGRALSETYAREPGFYGATYCCTCRAHFPVKEFHWTKDGEEVGS